MPSKTQPRKQNVHSFSSFYEQYAPYIKACALARMGSSSDADDLQSIVWMDIHKQLDRFQQPDPRKLLYRLVQWRAVDLVRQRQVQRYVHTTEEQLADLLTDAFASQQTTEHTNLRVSIKQVLATETQEDRAIVIGRYIEGTSWKERAQQLDMHRNTISRRAESCLQRLRRHFDSTQEMSS
jgi:RNA polymerase sigma factor (sigma-70 family)